MPESNVKILSGRFDDFYANTTVSAAFTIQVNGVILNLTGHAVTAYFTANFGLAAAITKVCDVATDPLLGIAYLNLSESDTDVSAGPYLFEVVAVLTTGEEYVVYSKTVNILKRV